MDFTTKIEGGVVTIPQYHKYESSPYTGELFYFNFFLLKNQMILKHVLKMEAFADGLIIAHNQKRHIL